MSDMFDDYEMIDFERHQWAIIEEEEELERLTKEWGIE